MKLRIKRFKNIKNTNDKAISMIKKKNFKATLISAENQFKGKGTMGKKWVSKKGNIFISIFFEFKFKNITVNNFAVLNPFILKSVLKKYIKKNIKIKWPNDLMIKKDKFCGILQETIIFNKKKIFNNWYWH